MGDICGNWACEDFNLILDGHHPNCPRHPAPSARSLAFQKLMGEASPERLVAELESIPASFNGVLDPE